MRLSGEERILLTKHLEVMLKSGMTISESLETLIEQSRSNGFRKIVGKILGSVKNGQKLSDALARQPQSFDSFYVNLIRIGEESGRLSENLIFLSHKLEKDQILAKKIQGVLFYPMIVVVAALVLGFGLSIFVLPRLSDLFSSLDVTLPLSTKILMWISGVMKKYNILILAGVVGFLGLFKTVVALPVIKPGWQNFLLSLPVLGRFLANMEMAAFTRNLGTLLNGGLTITWALEICTKSTKNLVYKKYFSKLETAINGGKSLTDELLGKGYQRFPLLATKMIGVGERSGRLGDMLLYLGDFFEGEIDNTAKNFASILEPMLLLAVGLMVAFLALAIVSPIYQLTGNIR